MNFSEINEYVVEALKLSASKERFFGVVSKINGTTTIVKSGEREFLSWSRPDLTVGTTVEFSIDQFQAVRVKVQNIPAAT
jgi:hypothetical protein